MHLMWFCGSLLIVMVSVVFMLNVLDSGLDFMCSFSCFGITKGAYFS